MDLEKNIRERCHVNTNEDGDSFVGVKADTSDRNNFVQHTLYEVIRKATDRYFRLIFQYRC